MKKFYPQIGGHDLKLNDFMLMQSAYSESIKGILGSITQNGTGILQGVSQTTSFSTSLLEFSAGWIGFNYEVFRFYYSTLPLFTVGSGTPPVFLKIKETIIVPDSPVIYEDTISKNVHYERIMVVKYFDFADGDINMVNGIYLSDIAYHNANQKGMVFEFYPSYYGEENDLFNNEGLGVKRMNGYALCNGLHNTPDLRGLFTVMPSINMKNPAALNPKAIPGISVNNVIGNEKSSILQSNIPDYNLLVEDPGHAHGFKAKSIAKSGTNTNPVWVVDNGGDVNTAPFNLTYAPDIKVVNNITNIVVKSNGGSQPLSTVSPAFTMIKIMKII